MEMTSIMIRVNSEAAQVFKIASEAQKRKFEALLNLKLTQATRKQRTLTEVMDGISDRLKNED